MTEPAQTPRFGKMPRRRLLVGLCLFAATAGQAAAPETAPVPIPAAVAQRPVGSAVFDNTLAIGGDDIAARKLNTRMTVAVNVEGRGPYRFVVDSGADTTVIGTRVARGLNLTPAEPVVLHGMTNTSEVARVHVDELGIGTSTFHDMKLPVLKEIDLGGDGMIGIDALVSQRLMMDFDKKIITVEDGARPVQKLDGEIVVVARRRRGQLILTQAAVDGHKLEAVIDTGSEITIGNSLLRKQLSRYATKMGKIEMTGVTGTTVMLDMLVLDELRLGPVVMRNVPIAFADVPPFKVFGMDQAPSLLLGTDMMANFRRVSLDFQRRRVRFQLRRCKGAEGIMLATSNGLSSRLGWNNTGGMTCL